MPKRIPLTQGRFTIVDDDMFDYLNQWKWHAHKERNNYYATNGSGHNIGGVIRMHRLIMNAQKGQQIDHCNNNGLDNQRGNLRFCTNSQNLQNARKHKNCSSRYKGVCWNTGKAKWQTNICINSKNIIIGRFDSQIKAALAYDKAAQKYFGEFAYLNFKEK